MTFLTDLARLREAATKGPWTAGHPISKEHYGVCAYDYTYAIPQDINDSRLIAYLVNHAEAIEGLVAAAENLRDVKGRHHTEIATVRLFDALEKLNRSE